MYGPLGSAGQLEHSSTTDLDTIILGGLVDGLYPGEHLKPHLGRELWRMGFALF